MASSLKYEVCSKNNRTFWILRQPSDLARCGWQHCNRHNLLSGLLFPDCLHLVYFLNYRYLNARVLVLVAIFASCSEVCSLFDDRRAEGTSSDGLPGAFWTSRQRWNFHSKDHHRRRELGLWLRHWDEGPVITMGWLWISTPKKSTTVSILYQSVAHGFFRFQWSGTFRIFATRSNSQPSVLRSCFEKVAWKNSQKETTIVARQFMVPSPWQCPCPLSLVNSQVLCQKSVDCSSPASLLPRPCSLRLFLISKIKISAERTPFRYHWWHQEEFVIGIEGHSKRSFPGLHGEVETPLEQVCE